MRTITALLFTFLLTTTVLFSQKTSSPNGQIGLEFTLSSGVPTYSVTYKGKTVLGTSSLGLELKDAPAFISGFTVVKIDSMLKDETWEPVWGEVKTIRNHYKEMAVTLAQIEERNRQLVIRFRVYDDGVGFRYEFPAQTGLKYFIVTNEITSFNLTGDHKAYWIPGDYDSNEYQYNTTLLSEVDAMEASKKAPEISVRTPFHESAVQTPLMMKANEGFYINIHEAALLDYPAMNLVVNKKNFSLACQLVPDAVGNMAYLKTPAKTPWRTVIVSDKATDILASKMILNLNEPSVIEKTDWIKPTKYVGIWWEMHVGKATWDYAGTQDTNNWTDLANAKPSGKHGATTENTKRYIDFAATHGFDGVLVEGWNVGWEDWFGNWKEDVFDFVTPYPDFNLKELNAYAKSKNVKLIMHHETSGSVTNYERWMDKGYDLMKANGYDAVKTGYVGKIIPRGEHHDGQWMVRHFERVAKATADRQIMLDAHEAVRPTGLHRTYPNWLASEASRGNEFNAWSVGNPPEHETILPFTRLMGGPMDYTPGIFQIKLDTYSPGKKERVHTTLAKQLALYVTLYSPLQMAADLPENYEKHLDAFQFIKDVPVDWDDTKIIEAEPGDYVTIARKEKGQPNWFIGSITDEQTRKAAIPLQFLDKDKSYVATIYADANNAHWERNPTAYTIQKYLVNHKTQLNIVIANGGGMAASIRPATEEEKKTVKGY